MIVRPFQLLVLGLLSLMLAACGGGGGGGGGSTSPTLQSLAVTPAAPSIAKGVGTQFMAVATFSDGTSRDVSAAAVWSSANIAVATVNSTGLATGKGAGTAVISATMNGLSASATLAVTAAVLQSIAITPASPGLVQGFNQQLKATGTFSDGTSQDVSATVAWASGTPSVATISASGLATAVASGTATISATLNQVTGSTVMTVTTATLQSIAVTPGNPSVASGLNEQFTATGSFSDGSSHDISNSVTWSSATPAVATTNASGLASAVAPGTSSITAAFNGIAGSTTLTVTAAVLKSIAVTPANPGIAKGTQQQFVATGRFSDGSSQDLSGSVAWASGNTAVATILSGGNATGAGVGNAVITASQGGISGSTTLTVSAAVLQSITVAPATQSIPQGQAQQFTATGHYSDGTAQAVSSVTWSSSATSIATASAAGVATGVGQGSAQITATSGAIFGSAMLTVSPAVQEAVLYSFLGGGSNDANPAGPLLMDASGNLYGVSCNCANGYGSGGAVFKVTAAGAETPLHLFQGGSSDGANPYGNLVMDASGNLFGTTFAGGASGGGTVFEITAAGSEQLLWSFGGSGDGAKPSAGLVRDASGNLYGTTTAGGANGSGTVFEISAGGTEKVLWSFGGNGDGATPSAAVVLDASGNLYGTTQTGGSNGSGTVFEIPSGGTEKVLWSFGGSGDGVKPYASLVRDASGNLYGTTQSGGANGYGTVFEIPAGGTEKVLYSFQGGSDGNTPIAGLVSDAAGNLYGSTLWGGVNGYGTVFEIPAGGVERVLYTFQGGSDGRYPLGGVILDASGKLYGASYQGGASGNGAVFRLTP